MKIKTKLAISLVVEVLIIFLLTEFAYHKIEEFRHLNNLVSTVAEVEQDLLKAEALLLEGKEESAVKELEKDIDELNRFSQPEATKVYTSVVSVISQISSGKDSESVIKFIENKAKELQQIEEKLKKENCELIQFTGDVVRIIPLFSLIIIGLGAISTYRAIVMPINEMTRTMKEIEKGDLTKALRIARDDELGNLAKEFNNFLGWIKNTFEELEKLSAKVSNEASMLVVELFNTDLKNQDIKEKFKELSISSEVLANSISDVNKLINSSSEEVREVNEETEKGEKIVENSVSDVQKLADEVISLKDKVNELQ